MTEATEDMIPVNSKICKTCKYSCKYDMNGTALCDYFIITGKQRKCPVGLCNHYEMQTVGKKNKRNVKWW